MQNDLPTGLPSFSSLKKHLDPDCSYLVFEREADFPRALDFAATIQSLVMLPPETMEWQLCTRTRRKNQLLLVCKMSPTVAEEIMQRLLQQWVPKGITYYLYSSTAS
jgi:hypothetical protein